MFFIVHNGMPRTIRQELADLANWAIDHVAVGLLFFALSKPEGKGAHEMQ